LALRDALQNDPFYTLDVDQMIDQVHKLIRRQWRAPTENYTDVWRGMHAAALVADAQADAVPKDFLEALEEAPREGSTPDKFRNAFD